jgi:hypothetical protein
MAREGVPNAQSAALECLRSLFLHSKAWELFCSKEGVRVVIRCLETGACDGDGNGVRVSALALLLEGCRASVIVRAEASRGGAGKVAAVLAMQVREKPFACVFLALEEQDKDKYALRGANDCTRVLVQAASGEL